MGGIRGRWPLAPTLAPPLQTQLISNFVMVDPSASGILFSSNSIFFFFKPLTISIPMLNSHCALMIHTFSINISCDTSEWIKGNRFVQWTHQGFVMVVNVCLESESMMGLFIWAWLGYEFFYANKVHQSLFVCFHHRKTDLVYCRNPLFGCWEGQERERGFILNSILYVVLNFNY